MSDLPRWLDREALALHISVGVHELPRLTRAGKLPQPSYHLGERSPRWWSADVDAAFGLAQPAPAARGAASLAQAILETGRKNRQAQAR